ncbi:hypothetical protein WEI85_00905 [Actinomycetes bacterium KLBMP 9797]
MKSIHLVLDTSAVVAYATGSEHVGEPLTQVAENDAAFTAPPTVLATAATQVDRAWVDLLTKHPAFEPVETEWTRWAPLAATLAVVGRLDAAEALLVALDFDCDVLTAEPELYAALGDDPPVITI